MVQKVSNIIFISNRYVEIQDYYKQITAALQNLRTFKAEQKLQQAAITFIVNELATKEDINDLQLAFKGLDRNKDAKLSNAEITAGFKKYIPEVSDEEIVSDYLFVCINF